MRSNGRAFKGQRTCNAAEGEAGLSKVGRRSAEVGDLSGSKLIGPQLAGGQIEHPA